MRTLFNLKPPSQYGVLRSVHWPYVRDGLRRNLEVILRYHRRNPQAVQGSHFLVRLLGAITIPHALNLDRYFENVDAGTFNTASALKLTSPVSKGAVFKGIFYGPGCHEVLIGHNDFFDIYDADRNWMNLQPVTVLRHPRSDLMMNLPDGKATGSEIGLAVIAINIPMLAIMYRAFCRYEEQAVPQGSRLSVYHFLRMYVLPNMLATHLDVALFNRIDNLQKGAPLGESKQPHSFALPDYSKKVTEVHLEILTYLKKKRQDFLGVLYTIPAAVKPNMAQVMEMPDVAPTMQITWALVLARLNTVAFLFKTAEERLHSLNQTEVSAVRRAIVSYRSDSVFSTVLPIEDYIEASLTLDDIFDQSVVSAA
jgi:hypothetical protein